MARFSTAVPRSSTRAKPVGTPDAGTFWRVISEHGPRALFTAPTTFRAIKKEDLHGKLLAQHDLSKFRTLFLAGERADPATLEWAEQMLRLPVIDHWWQTETGWAVRRQSGGARPIAGQARLAERGDAEIRRTRGRRKPVTRWRLIKWAPSWSSCRCHPVAPADLVASR